MKQVEFDIELVKKIQSGEVKGCIKTRNGEPARFLGELNNKMYPLVFALGLINKEIEAVDKFTIDGKYISTGEYSNIDIILEIEEERQKSEYQFKPFDKVLGRDEDNQLWKPDIFSFYKEDDLYRYRCLGDIFKQCIPYEGNQELVGTTNKPKED